MERITHTKHWHPVFLSARDPDEDLDPYGTAPSPPGPSGGSSDTPPRYEPPGEPQGRGNHRRLTLAAAGAVAALLLVALVLAWALRPVGGDNEWHRPVARIGESPPAHATLAERILLDATPSVVAPGRVLTYHWEVVEPEAPDVLFHDDGTARFFRRTRYSSRSPIVTVQFFTPGQAVLTLQVHDGRAYSEPVQVDFEVRELPRSS